MLIKTEAIVFKTIKYSETSIICKLYTAELGMRSYLVNGVRKSKSRQKAAWFQPLSLLNLTVYEREGKNLQRIKEIKPSYVFKSIPFDIIKSSVVLFLVEVLNKSLKEEEENKRLFRFLKNSIVSLDNIEGEVVNFHLKFLVELTKYIGFYPNNNFSEDITIFDLKEGGFTNNFTDRVTNILPPHSHLFSELLKKSEDWESKWQVNNEERKEILTFILRYYEYHIENFGKVQSVGVLEAVLS